MSVIIVSVDILHGEEQHDWSPAENYTEDQIGEDCKALRTFFLRYSGYHSIFGMRYLSHCLAAVSDPRRMGRVFCKTRRGFTYLCWPATAHSKNICTVKCCRKSLCTQHHTTEQYKQHPEYWDDLCVLSLRNLLLGGHFFYFLTRYLPSIRSLAWCWSRKINFWASWCYMLPTVQFSLCSLLARF